MIKSPKGLRTRLFLSVAAISAMGAVAYAQTSTSSTDAYQVQNVKITYKKLKLRQKDIPNAISVLGPKQIQAANPTYGSIQTLLTQSPSVVAYSQQPGQNNVTLAIRGVANDQLSETLDGVPINDLLDGNSGNYLSDGSIGSPVTLNEIDGVTIYPGLAPPAKQGFGTTGGTIAYTSKQPTDDRYEELEGGFGSFDTQHVGFVINTGKMYDDIDAPKALILYDQSQTAGYVTNTQAQFHDFEFNLQKPYDDGQSKVGLLILFNQGKGFIQTLPAPSALINSVGQKFNYPKSLAFYEQEDQDLTTILSDETYINQYAIFNGSLFFHHNTTAIDNYASPEAVDDGYVYNGLEYTPNVQGIYNFFGCIGGIPQMTYDPTAGGTQTCEDGESDNTIYAHSNIVGITPTLTLFPDQYNTVVIGGLIAKTNGNTTQYVYGGSGYDIPQVEGYNGFEYGGGQQRTIFSGYAQDTIRLFDNKLQITPGVKVDAAYSSYIQIFKDGFPNPYAPDTLKLANFTKVGGYYIGASYNLPDNFVLYGSAGKGSLFAPVNDYSEGTTSAGAPTGSTNTLEPEIVHLYEGGIRYDTPELLLNVDYYYENVSDAFAFFENFLTNAQYYGNTGGELYRGVEGNGDYQVTPDLSVFGNFSYNEAIYTKSFFAFDTLAQDQYGYAFTGTPLSNVPAWNGLVGVDYSWGPFTIYATGQYTGQEFTTDDLDAPPYGNTYYVGQTADGTLIPGNAEYPYGSPTPVALTSTPNNPNGCTETPTECAAGEKVPANDLDGATVTNQKVQNPANFVVDILLTYKIPLPGNIPLQSLTASLDMQNILDERYYTYTYASENPVDGIYDPHLPGGEPYDSGFIGQPRSFMVDLTAKF
jgi:iron complex outermembrane receptor protein